MSRPHLTLYVEAALSLVVARADVLLRPARRHFSSRGRGLADASPELIADVRRALLSASSRLPIRAQCYEQALAARAMLARRGMASTLHFGGGKQDGELTAHVWLTSGPHFVVGQDAASSHSPLISSD